MRKSILGNLIPLSEIKKLKQVYVAKYYGNTEFIRKLFEKKLKENIEELESFEDWCLGMYVKKLRYQESQKP